MRNVVYIQENEFSCGSMCIASVLSFYGDYNPIEKINEDVKLSDKGINLYNMVNAFRKYGFKSDGLRINKGDLSKYKVPFIALLGNHFVVVYKVGCKVKVMDPSCGMLRINNKTFLDRFSGIIVICYKEASLSNKMRQDALKVLIKSIFKEEKKNILKVLLLNLVLSILSLLFAFYIKYNLSITLFIIFLLIIICINVLTIIIGKIKIKSSIKVKDSLNKYILNHLFNIETRFITNKKVGEIINKINRISFLENILVKIIYEDTTNLFIIILISFIFIKINITIFICLLIFNFFIIIHEIHPYIKNKNKLDTLIYYDNKYLGSLYDYINAFETIKTFNVEGYAKDKLNNIYGFFLSSFKKYSEYINFHNSRANFFNNLFLLVFNTIILYLIRNKLIGTDYLVILNFLIGIYINSISSICLTIKGLLEISLYLNNIKDFLYIDSNDDFNLYKRFKSLKVYDNTNLLMKIRPNENIFIRGESGTGKTTLALNIAKIRVNFNREILLNNYNIKNIKNINDYIIYISSNTHIFEGSIKENISFNKTININKILEICLINKLLNRKRITIYDKLENLSTGEKAKIILARALAKKPDILIIDELLSSLSLEEENTILKNLFQIKDLSIIYISHRESKIKFDKTINIEKEVKYEVM